MSKIAFFDNSGVLIDTSDRQHDDIFQDRGIAYQADYYIIGGHKYDLSNPDSISSIPIPNFKPGNAAVLDMSYITKIRCGSEEDAELIPAFVNKTLELMLASKMLWGTRDYLQAYETIIAVISLIPEKSLKPVFVPIIPIYSQDQVIRLKVGIYPQNIISRIAIVDTKNTK